jgi:hypothetical protein
MRVPATGPVTVLLGVHAHQPAGNFPEVLEHAHERCYRPFLQTLHDYPAFRFSMHVSGPLLGFLNERFPDDMTLLAAMVSRGQVELFGAGDTEPVLVSIPNRDRVGQIEGLSERLEQRFGARPHGAWLTERVWESTVVPALADCGIRYVTVDDYHFLCAGVKQQALDGFFTTDEDGRTLDLFPISEALRYRIPFAPAAEAVAYLESLGTDRDDVAAVYFDDIEKLGIWPETYEWVYEKRWLREFVEGVLASPSLRTSTYRDYHARARTRGVVYLPTTSYVEMNEWTLPPEAARVYTEVLGRAKASGRYEVEKPFVRGGIWRNFLSRYPESNWMHKRMLSLSARLAATRGGAERADLRDLLYRAQANDAYWHGLFGGLYLPHLRRAIWNSLLGLERALDAIAKRPPVERGDPDHDGVVEVALRSGELQAVVSLDGSASVREFASYALAQNFGDTLRRHAEIYHEKVRRRLEAAHEGAGIASAHDRVTFKHAIEAWEAEADPEPQATMRDTWRPSGGEAQRLGGYVETAPTSPAGISFRHALGGGSLEKSIAVQASTLIGRWRLPAAVSGTFSTRLSIAMPSCDGFTGRYLLDGSPRAGFGQLFEHDRVAEFSLDDRFMQGRLAVVCDPPAAVSARPYHTISQSEEGFERVMQSVTVELSWNVEAAAPADIRLELRVEADD